MTARALGEAWRAGVLPKGTLDPAKLVATAMRREGVRDFGPGDWKTPLEILTGDLRNEAQLNPLGRTMAHGQMLKALQERLRATALIDAHPEIEDIDLSAPIVVIGPMRSGTTRVQRLLARDPRLSHTRTFETMDPVPSHPSLRPMQVRAGLWLLQRLNPAIGHIHPTSAGAAEEEFGFFAPTFNAALFETQWDVPAYARWLAQADRADAYSWFRRFLQITAWHRGEMRPAPWVLKAPEFMDGLDALLDTFPDARLLVLSRDAKAVVASSASLIHEHRRLHSDHVDPIAIGRESLSLYARRARRTLAVLAARPDVPRHHMDFGAMNADWRGEVARVYDFLGMPLTDEIVARMAAYLDGARRHRAHSYDAADYAITDADIAELPDF